VALAIKAVEAGYRGYFSGADDMVRALLTARRDGTFAAKLRTFTAPTVLVLDDVGLLPIDAEGAGVFFHVVNARYERGHPALVRTNRGLPGWGEVFGDAVVAGAILDRLMHWAVVFNIRGPSWRMREHAALTEATRTERSRPRQPPSSCWRWCASASQVTRRLPRSRPLARSPPTPPVRRRPRPGCDSEVGRVGHSTAGRPGRLGIGLGCACEVSWSFAS